MLKNLKIKLKLINNKYLNYKKICRVNELSHYYSNYYSTNTYN